jgi:glycosyltransferase involved in cell wall biosynthesis
MPSEVVGILGKDRMMGRTLVLVAGTNCLGGVTSWASVLRRLFADHPRYDVRLLYVGRGRDTDGFDFVARSVSEAEVLIRRLAPVVVLPNYIWELFQAAHLPGVKCIGMCHADDDEQYYRPLTWYEGLAARFIAVSPECGTQLANRNPCRSSDIDVLPYGVHVPKNMRRDYQIRPLRLVYAGRITQLQKRVRDFVPLVGELERLGVHYEFDIVGEGDEDAALREAMGRVATTGVVRFHGRVPADHMSQIWSAHDVFIQVSDFEGTSVSMLEAIAHGLVPVVTAASSGIEGVIRSGENGFVVPVGDMPALARAVVRLSTESGLLATLGQAAHQSAQAYALEPYRDRFTEVLDKVASAPERIDLHARYGMFGHAHPLFRRPSRPPIHDRILTASYRTLVPSAMRRYLAKRHQGDQAD